jgi:hypothetical protein
MGLRIRRAWGFIARGFSPGYSFCGRCGRPWTVCEGHSTPYTKGSGCFPLCKECWSELKPGQRIPYYRSLWREWNKSPSALSEQMDITWMRISKAVMEGK